MNRATATNHDDCRLPDALIVACGDAQARQRRDHPGVLRETAINDDGSVLIRELDHDLLQYDAAAADATRAPRPVRAAVPFDRGPRYVLLSDGAPFAGVDKVAS